MPVPIVIDKCAAGSETRLGGKQTRFLRHIGEGAVAVVAVQNVLTPVSDEQVFESVVVVITDGHAVRVPGAK
jgi:hypothetical protein